MGSELFRRFSHRVSGWVGSPIAFVLAFATIVIWALLGPTFGYSDTWQLVINTSTTIVTFLMVFLIQNTQNRDARAIHLKLDELIRANIDADNALIDLEAISDQALDELHAKFCKLKEVSEAHIERIEEHKERR